MIADVKVATKPSRRQGVRVFFTGATGAIGRHTVPRLVELGHDVVAIARSEGSRRWLRAMGAVPVDVDLFDPAALSSATRGMEGVVHMATAIPPMATMTKRGSWEMNDRLRSEATRLLVDASMANGVSRFIQQSISLVYADGGDEWIDEDAPVAPVWEVLESALDAEGHVGRFGAGGGIGTVLRFGGLYGPGRVSAEFIGAVSARKVPVVGRGDNFVSHIHVDDAAAAIAVALETAGGVYNVTDDVPVTKRAELDSLAEALGARPPRGVPVWAARPMIGPAVGLLTISHRVSNSRFRQETGWAPGHPSVTDSWEEVLDDGA